MPDRTSELADNYADMQKLVRSTESDGRGEVVDGEWYLIERASGRRWIEESGLYSDENLLKFHESAGDKITPVVIYRKS